MAGGRPLTFKSVEDLQEKIEEFKAYCEEKQVPLTVERLAVILECDSETISNYGKKEEFFGTVRQIKNEIKAEKMENLNAGKGSPIGIKFDLINNHGMREKSEVKQEVSGKLSLTDVLGKAKDKK